MINKIVKCIRNISKIMIFRFLFVILIFVYSLKPVFSELDFKSEINEINANVVFLRHSIAPGFGDPKNFKIDDCSTQRNLSKTGILQARSIGKFFIENNIEFSEILSSQWCRCKDTINEMNIGNWKTFPGLNSFFQNFSKKQIVLPLLYDKLKNVKNDELILLVTHQVVISEITNVSSPSGGIVIYNTKNKKAKLIRNITN